MNVLETFRVAARALLRNKTRSFLTTLGIIIGVGAVIAMVSIGEGAKAMIQQSFASMGTNLLILRPGSSASRGVRGGMGSMPSLTWDDLRAIRAEISNVRLASPVLRYNSQILSEDQNWSTTVQGISPEYFDIRKWKAVLGSLFTESEVDSNRKVAVLGKTVVEKLFGAHSDPIGQWIRVGNTPFEILGVLASKGQSGNGQDFDDVVIIPYTTFQSRIQGGLAKFIRGAVFIEAQSDQVLTQTENQITQLLRERHNLAPGAEDDFSIRNLSEIADAYQDGMRTLTTLLASIAAVSLLVGGIGIMNIMLVSVTERTREIGVRMAIGARPRDILAQFLVEALVLSTIGGFLGVSTGLLAGRYLADSFQWPMLVRPDIIAVSVAFSALVGIIFGLYPARKASQLDPIDALRYE